MAGHEDSSGDYGYDLAHEVTSFLQLPVGLHRPVTRSPVGTRRDLDPEADLGYDHAHEL